MRGTSRLAEWIESTDLATLLTPGMERQTENQETEESLIQWREEYRTHWHAHLKAIRMGLWLVMILLIAGVVLPLPLYLFADVKFRTVMAIAAVTPVPFLAFCIVFAPVLIFGDRPKNATAEWNAMYVQLSFLAIFFPVLAILWQVHYIWSRWGMQPRDNGWIWMIQAALIAVPVIFLCIPSYSKEKTPASRIFYRNCKLRIWHVYFLLCQCSFMQTGPSLSSGSSGQS